MKCLFKLYNECVVINADKELQNIYKSDPTAFVQNFCSLCHKAYRLKKGLVFKHDYKGLRSGVTL